MINALIRSDWWWWTILYALTADGGKHDEHFANIHLSASVKILFLLLYSVIKICLQFALLSVSMFCCSRLVLWTFANDCRIIVVKVNVAFLMLHAFLIMQPHWSTLSLNNLLWRKCYNFVFKFDYFVQTSILYF